MQKFHESSKYYRLLPFLVCVAAIVCNVYLLLNVKVGDLTAYKIGLAGFSCYLMVLVRQRMNEGFWKNAILLTAIFSLFILAFYITVQMKLLLSN